MENHAIQGSVPLPAPGLNDDIVTLRQLLDAISLSSENTEKITKVTNLLDAFLRGFLRRRRVEGHDVVKRGCMVDGVKLFPFNSFDFAFVPQTDAAIIQRSERARILRDLNVSLYCMDGVVSETEGMGTRGVLIEIEIAGIQMKVDFRDRDARGLEEDKFMAVATKDYPAFAQTFAVVAYILHRKGWMFTRARPGSITPLALSAILVSFFDQLPRNLATRPFSNEMVLALFEWIVFFPWSAIPLAVRRTPQAPRSNSPLHIYPFVGRNPNDVSNIASSISKAAVDGMLDSFRELLKTHVREGELDCGSLLPLPDLMLDHRQMIQSFDVNPVMEQIIAGASRHCIELDGPPSPVADVDDSEEEAAVTEDAEEDAEGAADEGASSEDQDPQAVELATTDSQDGMVSPAAPLLAAPPSPSPPPSLSPSPLPSQSPSPLPHRRSREYIQSSHEICGSSSRSPPITEEDMARYDFSQTKTSPTPAPSMPLKPFHILSLTPSICVPKLLAIASQFGIATDEHFIRGVTTHVIVNKDTNPRTLSRALSGGAQVLDVEELIGLLRHENAAASSIAAPDPNTQLELRSHVPPMPSSSSLAFDEPGFAKFPETGMPRLPRSSSTPNSQSSRSRYSDDRAELHRTTPGSGSMHTPISVVKRPSHSVPNFHPPAVQNLILKRSLGLAVMPKEIASWTEPVQRFKKPPQFVSRPLTSMSEGPRSAVTTSLSGAGRFRPPRSTNAKSGLNQSTQTPIPSYTTEATISTHAQAVPSPALKRSLGLVLSPREAAASSRPTKIPKGNALASLAGSRYPRFVFGGGLAQTKQLIRNKIEAVGGRIDQHVSAETNFCVVKAALKAYMSEKLSSTGVKVLSEQEFDALIENFSGKA